MAIRIHCGSIGFYFHVGKHNSRCGGLWHRQAKIGWRGCEATKGLARGLSKAASPAVIRWPVIRSPSGRRIFSASLDFRPSRSRAPRLHWEALTMENPIRDHDRQMSKIAAQALSRTHRRRRDWTVHVFGSRLGAKMSSPVGNLRPRVVPLTNPYSGRDPRSRTLEELRASAEQRSPQWPRSDFAFGSGGFDGSGPRSRALRLVGHRRSARWSREIQIQRCVYHVTPTMNNHGRTRRRAARQVE